MCLSPLEGLEAREAETAKSGGFFLWEYCEVCVLQISKSGLPAQCYLGLTQAAVGCRKYCFKFTALLCIAILGCGSCLF